MFLHAKNNEVNHSIWVSPTPADVAISSSHFAQGTELCLPPSHEKRAASKGPKHVGVFWLVLFQLQMLKLNGFRMGLGFGRSFGVSMVLWIVENKYSICWVVLQRGFLVGFCGSVCQYLLVFLGLRWPMALEWPRLIGWCSWWSLCLGLSRQNSGPSKQWVKPVNFSKFTVFLRGDCKI